jgi:hypothetical protein
MAGTSSSPDLPIHQEVHVLRRILVSLDILQIGATIEVFSASAAVNECRALYRFKL